VVRHDAGRGGERRVGEDGGQQEKAAGLRIDEQRVLADPAQAGEPGEVALGERRGIDDGAGAAAGHFGLEPRGDRVGPRPQ
jgi:hypothetical protein